MIERRAHGEGGVTLVELLVAIVILGIAFVAILGSMATGAIASRKHRSQASANTILVSAAEQVKAASYHVCASLGAYDPALATVELTGGFAAPTITEVHYWDGTSFAATCTTDRKLQLITISVTDGDATEVLSVVKRDPAVP